MFIDTHVHCRDGKQAYKETIEHALSVAYRVGMSAIANVGNGDPAVTDEESLKFYLDKADKANSPVKFFQWIGLTSEPKQIEEAIRLWHEYPEVIGFKLFAGHSVGNLGVIERDEQRRVFEVLTRNDYKGVLKIHCEKEDYIEKDFDPKYPIIHCRSRPAIAEIASVSDMLEDALESGYQGRIHIAHVSCPESVDMRYKHPLRDRISCGAGPHHLIMNEEHMNEKNGIYKKKNPPLRDWERVKKLRKQFFRGYIDIYESDHAPHAKREKENPPYLSGFPQLPIFPLFLRWLKSNGMTDETIERRTFWRTKEIFAPKLDEVEPRKDVSLDNLEGLIKEVPALRKEYEYDAWDKVFDPWGNVL